MILCDVLYLKWIKTNLKSSNLRINDFLNKFRSLFILFFYVLFINSFKHLTQLIIEKFITFRDMTIINRFKMMLSISSSLLSLTLIYFSLHYSCSSFFFIFAFSLRFHKRQRKGMSCFYLLILITAERSSLASFCFLFSFFFFFLYIYRFFFFLCLLKNEN